MASKSAPLKRALVTGSQVVPLPVNRTPRRRGPRCWSAPPVVSPPATRDVAPNGSEALREPGPALGDGDRPRDAIGARGRRAPAADIAVGPGHDVPVRGLGDAEGDDREVRDDLPRRPVRRAPHPPAAAFEGRRAADREEAVVRRSRRRLIDAPASASASGTRSQTKPSAERHTAAPIRAAGIPDCHEPVRRRDDGLDDAGRRVPEEWDRLPAPPVLGQPDERAWIGVLALGPTTTDGDEARPTGDDVVQLRSQRPRRRAASLPLGPRPASGCRRRGRRGRCGRRGRREAAWRRRARPWRRGARARVQGWPGRATPARRPGSTRT